MPAYRNLEIMALESNVQHANGLEDYSGATRGTAHRNGFNKFLMLRNEMQTTLAGLLLYTSFANQLATLKSEETHEAVEITRMRFDVALLTHTALLWLLLTSLEAAYLRVANERGPMLTTLAMELCMTCAQAFVWIFTGFLHAPTINNLCLMPTEVSLTSMLLPTFLMVTFCSTCLIALSAILQAVYVARGILSGNKLGWKALTMSVEDYAWSSTRTALAEDEEEAWQDEAEMWRLTEKDVV